MIPAEVADDDRADTARYSATPMQLYLASKGGTDDLIFEDSAQARAAEIVLRKKHPELSKIEVRGRRIILTA